MFTITYISDGSILYTISTPSRETALLTFSILRRHYAARLWHSSSKEQTMIL